MGHHFPFVANGQKSYIEIGKRMIKLWKSYLEVGNDQRKEIFMLFSKKERKKNNRGAFMEFFYAIGKGRGPIGNYPC